MKAQLPQPDGTVAIIDTDKPAAEAENESAVYNPEEEEVHNRMPQTVKVNYPPYKPTAAELKTLRSAKVRLDKIWKLIEDTQSIKGTEDALVEDVIEGKLGLEAAGPMLAQMSVASGNRAKYISAIKSPLKARIRELVQGEIKGILQNEKEHQVDHIVGMCKDLEATERKQQEELGLHADEFVPSALLQSLRETHKRLVTQKPHPSREDVDRLLGITN